MSTTIADAVDDLMGACESKVAHMMEARTSLERTASDLRQSVETGQPRYSAEQREYHAQFVKWLLNPADERLRLQQAVDDLQTRDVSIASNVGGGYALPAQIAATFESYARPACPLLDPSICGAIQTDTTDYRAPIGRADGASNRVSETATRPATATSTLAIAKPTWGTYYAYCAVSEWSRQDLGDRLATFLAQEFAAEVGAQLMGDILTGDGVGKVSGIILKPPVTTNDLASPMRANDTLQYSFLSGATVVLGDIENLLSQFAENYLQADDFRWIMRPSTWTKVFGVGRSGTGSIEAPFLMPVTAPALYGQRVALSSVMPSIAANAFAIAAGSWKRGYLLTTRGPAGLTIDEVTTPGVCHYHYRQRFGGCVKASPAIKLLKFATS